MATSSKQTNEIQAIYYEQMREVRRLYPPLISATLEKLAAGQTVSEAVDNAFKETFYETQCEELTVSNSMRSAEVGLGEQLTLNTGLAKDYFLFTNFRNGVNLSDTIHSGEAQRAIKGVLNDYFKMQGNVAELTRKLGNVNGAARTDIPKALREIVELNKGLAATKDARKFEAAIRKAQRQVDLLNSRGVTETARLQRAYQGIIDAVNSGGNVDDAVQYAMNRKVDYINRRIARTEFANAYEMSFQRQMEEGGFKYEKFALSSAHPRRDQCDFCAEADLYGLGAGVAPAGKGFSIPVHPNCLCTKVPLMEPETDGSGRYSKERAQEYLDGLTDAERARTIGVKYAENGNYVRGLEKQGLKPNPSPRILSKSIIQEK